jgi:hypothetical protein
MGICIERMAEIILLKFILPFKKIQNYGNVKIRVLFLSPVKITLAARD